VINPVRRTAVLLGLGMAGTAALSYIAIPRDKIADRWQTDLNRMFPVSFDGWRVDKSMPVILPAPDVQAKLDAIYNQVLSRTYVNASGDRIMLSVAYGGDQSDGMSAHLPEVCYPAQGFQVSGQKSVTLALAGRTVPATTLLTRLGGRYEPVTYWLTLGETVAATRTARKLAQMRYGLKGMIPDGMLVRVSSIDRDADRAFQLQARFLDQLIAAIPGDQLSRVVGAAPTERAAV
jgi:EpsI family protein